MDNRTLEINLFLTTERQVVSHDIMRLGENDPFFKQIGTSIPFDATVNGFYTLIDGAPLTGTTLYLIKTNLVETQTKFVYYITNIMPICSMRLIVT